MDNSRQAISPAAQQIPGFDPGGNDKKFLSLNFAWKISRHRVKAGRSCLKTVPLLHPFCLVRTASVQDFLRHPLPVTICSLFLHPALKNTTFVGGGKSFATSRLQRCYRQP
ncbi:hypothetical protein [Enterobacter sp. ENT03]|uniref:hypothetical protein n=1 Tax=Enterobacter sp. ENT03 TaxID=2854780 RepID=UPI001C45D810|nr:hypothetical protein [Enterobacter sp. ENT03]MBV7403825.1 hypothetical protein [Enterobacter sp. ENT03]